MYEKFVSIISEISKVPVARIHEGISFRDDLGIDSLQFVNLLVVVADKFHIELSSIHSVDDLNTVGKMYEKIVRREKA